ncbi:hypothetical protein [Nocardioides sp. 503]|jgi:hypothetical protein|uniref:hypothetical protein n=1 Tax=Nocardioides sp. 503 TaxID=2508326 RepID=UPI00106F6E6F|nr:hypothetical protein [Nocardioides sp. 503]
MTLKASLEDLAEAAAGWDGVSAEVSTASKELFNGSGQGFQFGWFAQRAGIDSQHDQFISSMISAMSNGVYQLHCMAEALRHTAKDFGATDASVADEFHNPDGTPT